GTNGIGVVSEGKKYGGNFTTSGSSGIALLAQSYNASARGLVVQGFTSQTGNLLEFRNDSGTLLSYFDAAGQLHGTGGGGGGGGSGAAGNDYNVQYNVGGTLTADDGFSYDGAGGVSI